jgi:hypothetical protein
VDADAEPGTILLLGGRASTELRLFGSCVMIGTWLADTDGLFIGSAYGTSGSDRSCSPIKDSTPSWLQRVTGFRVDGENPIGRLRRG